jgi:hypothetical protein
MNQLPKYNKMLHRSVAYASVYPAPFPNTPQLGIESYRLAAGMEGLKKILSAGSNTPLKGAGFILK